MKYDSIHYDPLITNNLLLVVERLDIFCKKVLGKTSQIFKANSCDEVFCQ